MALLCLGSLSVSCLGYDVEIPSITTLTTSLTSETEAVRDPRIPSMAYALKRQVRAEVNYQWGLEQRGTVFYAQIHQESSWNPDAKSKYASGLAQFTPDTAEWISKLYPADLGENNPLDAKWAIRGCVKMDKWLHNKFPNAITDDDRWAFILSSYNSGVGWTWKERDSAASKGKNREQWWCSVQHELVKAKWAFDESRSYVDKIIFKWIPMYSEAGFL